MREGLGSVHLSTLVGLLVVLAGLTSASALVNAFVGYLREIIAIDATTAIVMSVLALGGIAAIGITESVTVASVITAIELLGLLLVVGVNYQSFGAFPAHIDVLAPPISLQGWGLILSGAMLAFYAFLGFEDMVVIAEKRIEGRHRGDRNHRVRYRCERYYRDRNPRPPPCCGRELPELRRVPCTHRRVGTADQSPRLGPDPFRGDAGLLCVSRV